MRIWRYLATVWLLCFGTVVHTQSPMPVPKIGVVDITKLFTALPKAQALDEAIQRDMKAQQTPLHRQHAECQEIKRRLERDGKVMSKTERERLEQTLLEKERKMKATALELEKKGTAAAEAAAQEMQAYLRSIIKEFGKAHAFVMIFDKNTPWFVREDIEDITDALIQLYASPSSA